MVLRYPAKKEWVEVHDKETSTDSKETSAFSSSGKLLLATSKNNKSLIRSDRSAQGANRTTLGRKLTLYREHFEDMFRNIPILINFIAPNFPAHSKHLERKFSVIFKSLPDIVFQPTRSDLLISL